jgi:hypothetical protein
MASANPTPDTVMTPRRKAFDINMDPRRYGTFAEIGAGQEVVRWFFQAGGAAGTIAKSMSAYDMTVSDAIYGPCARYVHRDRLQQMLDHEYALNLSRLSDQRGNHTSFFAFADTVVAKGYKGTRDCHGWMGVKFQAHPRDEASQIIIHVRMLDNENAAQQEALGIAGVNLLYGAFFHHHEPELLLKSLLDNLSTRRIEIDMIEFSGIEFRNVDNRLMSLQLVQLGLSDAAMFGPDGTVLQPSEVFHNKSILVERGSFRPVCNTNLDILRAAREVFEKEPGVTPQDVLPVMEITMRYLLATGEIDYDDFLARADLLQATGHAVLISNYFEYYRLAAYLRRQTREHIGLTMGAASLIELFDEKYYTHLDGGILESFGRLFNSDLKIYVYPMKDSATGDLLTLHNIKIAPHLQQLFGYLVQRRCIIQLDNHNPACLDIFSREILRHIATGDCAWQDMVPPQVAALIKQRRYFGCRCP